MQTEELSNTVVETSELVKVILADLFVLYVKARNYHWNVTGPQFYNLHETFENIYNELADDIDTIAERIRALGSNTPGTMKEFWELSSLEEKADYYPVSQIMVQEIVSDFERIIKKLNSSAGKMQSSLNDEVTAGMFYGFMEKYQKTVWMLKSLLEQ